MLLTFQDDASKSTSIEKINSLSIVPLLGGVDACLISPFTLFLYYLNSANFNA